MTGMYFTETDKQHIDGIFYQSMVDETIRLRNCRSRRERSEIRAFLLSAYQEITESSVKDLQKDKVLQSMQQQQ